MGGPAAVQAATLTCTFGVAPSTLLPIPGTVVVEGRMAATVVDASPLVNIPPFGMCTSPSNPQVAAATAAALGVLTPMPCVPVTAAWMNGATKTFVGGKPVLTMGAQCQCAYGGVIQIVNPGATKTVVS